VSSLHTHTNQINRGCIQQHCVVECYNKMYTLQTKGWK